MANSRIPHSPLLHPGVCAGTPILFSIRLPGLQISLWMCVDTIPLYILPFLEYIFKSNATLLTSVLIGHSVSACSGLFLSRSGFLDHFRMRPFLLPFSYDGLAIATAAEQDACMPRYQCLAVLLQAGMERSAWMRVRHPWGCFERCTRAILPILLQPAPEGSDGEQGVITREASRTEIPRFWRRHITPM